LVAAMGGDSVCVKSDRRGMAMGGSRGRVSGTLGILPFMAKWTLGILDGGGSGVGGVTTVCGRDYIAIACYVHQWIT